MGFHNEAIFQVYNGALELSIQIPHDGIFSSSKMTALKGHLAYLTYNITRFHFSQ